MAAMTAGSTPGGATALVPGALNRVVRVAVANGVARAVVEDDFHHFRLTVRHAGGVVESLTSEGFRSPYSLCPAAGERLQELVGFKLTPKATDVFLHTDARLQCTHQFDLAALAITAAARGEGREYQINVPDLVDGRTNATLRSGGRQILSWIVEEYGVVAPAPFRGLALGRGFTDWVSKSLDAEQAEAALVLRRGVFVSRGRRMLEELDAQIHAPDRGGCWVRQPGRAEGARRNVRSWRDFSADPGGLTRSDDAWLAFADLGLGAH